MGKIRDGKIAKANLKSTDRVKLTSKDKNIEMSLADFTDYLNSTLSPTSSDAGYSVYTATISQSGTSAPVLTELKNTLGATITPTYSGTLGVYLLTSVGTFTAGKTIVDCYKGYTAGANEYVMETFVVDTDVINVVSRDNGNLANSILTSDQFWIEIRVYN